MRSPRACTCAPACAHQPAGHGSHARQPVCACERECTSPTLPGALSLAPAFRLYSFVLAQHAELHAAVRYAAMAAAARLVAVLGEAVHAGQSAVVNKAHEHFAFTMLALALAADEE